MEGRAAYYLRVIVVAANSTGVLPVSTVKFLLVQEEKESRTAAANNNTLIFFIADFKF